MPRAHALALRGDSRDHDELLDRLGGARFVLIGEASHGEPLEPTARSGTRLKVEGRNGTH